MKISDIEVDFRLNIPLLSVSSKTVAKAEEIIMKYEGRDTDDPHDLEEEIIERAKSAFRNGETVSPKDLKSLAFASLSIDQDKEREFVRLIFKELQKHGTRRHFSALFRSYVLNFDSNNENCLEAAKILARNKKNLGKSWSLRLEKIDLLDSKNIEKKIANKLLDKGSDGFNEIGLWGSISSWSLVRASLVCLAGIVKEKVLKGDTAVIDSFWDVICEDDRIRVGAEIAAMIGLLSPFFEDDPPAALKSRLQSIFTKSISDPRVENSKWPEVIGKFGGSPFREKCISLVKKWLNFESIDLFLKVIAKHAPSEQFEARETLWKSYADQEHVMHAYPVFGKDAARTAKKLKASEQSAAGLIFGELLPGQVQADQSVLLMCIGNLIIAEWSHNGKFRAWYDDADHKPELYRGGYHANKLRKDSNEILQGNGYYGDGIVHIGDWVERVKEYIKEETGIRLSRRVVR